MRVEFHPEATAEFRAAAEYYEKQHSGLGNRFISSVEAAVAHIADAPSSWRIVEDEVRRGHALPPRTGLLARSGINTVPPASALRRNPLVRKLIRTQGQQIRVSPGEKS